MPPTVVCCGLGTWGRTLQPAGSAMASSSARGVPARAVTVPSCGCQSTSPRNASREIQASTGASLARAGRGVRKPEMARIVSPCCWPSNKQSATACSVVGRNTGASHATSPTACPKMRAQSRSRVVSSAFAPWCEFPCRPATARSCLDSNAPWDPRLRARGTGPLGRHA